MQFQLNAVQEIFCPMNVIKSFILFITIAEFSKWLSPSKWCWWCYNGLSFEILAAELICWWLWNVKNKPSSPQMGHQHLKLVSDKLSLTFYENSKLQWMHYEMQEWNRSLQQFNQWCHQATAKILTTAIIKDFFLACLTISDTFITVKWFIGMTHHKNLKLICL